MLKKLKNGALKNRKFCLRKIQKFCVKKWKITKISLTNTKKLC